jgi:hypothetical protein
VRPFGGNFKDAGGGYTGQIFFSGEDGRNAHYWVVHAGHAYDILFGTTGAAVLGFVAGEYTLDPHDKNKFVKVSGTGPDRIKGGQGKADANQHGFTPAYGPA